MVTKTYQPEQIINNLWEAEVPISQGIITLCIILYISSVLANILRRLMIDFSLSLNIQLLMFVLRLKGEGA